MYNYKENNSRMVSNFIYIALPLKRSPDHYTEIINAFFIMICPYYKFNSKKPSPGVLRSNKTQRESEVKKRLLIKKLTNLERKARN